MGRPKKRLNETGDETGSGEIDLETRRRILKAAETLFVTKGYKGVSMKDLAEAVQVTPAALYYHFPGGKEDLFLDIIKAMFEEWAAGVAVAIAPAKDIRERLKLLTYYFLGRSSDNFPMLMRDVNELIKDDAKKHAVWHHYGDTFMQAIINVFEEAIERGEVSQHFPAQTIASMYHGMNIALLRDPRKMSWCNDQIEVERYANIVVSVLLDGIGVRQPASLLT